MTESTSGFRVFGWILIAGFILVIGSCLDLVVHRLPPIPARATFGPTFRPSTFHRLLAGGIEVDCGGWKVVTLQSGDGPGVGIYNLLDFVIKLRPKPPARYRAQGEIMAIEIIQKRNDLQLRHSSDGSASIDVAPGQSLSLPQSCSVTPIGSS